MSQSRILVIKFGGDIVEGQKSLENLALTVKQLKQDGYQIILVHGGGPIASSLAKKMGLEPKMVGGRRVTCAQTLNIIKMALPGVVNSDILALFKKFGLPAVAASAINLIDCHKRRPKVVSGSDGKKVDFGFVGDVDSAHVDLLKCLIGGGYIPIVSPLSCDKNGQLLNINADTIAVQIAQEIDAYRFILVTKVGGVFLDLNDPSSKISKMTMEVAQSKIKDGVILGGMIPKLEESFKLLEKGLDSFHIVGPDTETTIVDEINNPGSQGTVIFKGEI